jgi:hypothetical protein
MLSAYVCANGAIATGTVIVATRHFQESSNRILVDRKGIEPNRQPPYILWQRIYSPP